MPSLAANLVRNCLRITSNDNVTVFFYPHTQKLAEEIATECFKVGADALLNLYTDAYWLAYMKNLPLENLRKPSVFCRGLTELSTAQFWVGSLYDPAVFRKVPPERMEANDESETVAHEPAQKRKVRSLWVAMGQVTRPRAKAYGFSFPAWERMVRAASSVPPARLQADGKRVAAILESGDRVRVTAPNGTDLQLSVAGRTTRISDGVVDDEDIARGALGSGIPTGAVDVCPVETSAEGSVAFDLPQAWAGRTIRRLRWTFSEGRVTAWEGDAVADRLKEQWEKSSGDRDRIAFLQIGLNPRATYGFLQNDIVRGAVLIGIGSNQFSGGPNKSSFGHSQTLSRATVEVDGKPIVRAGKLLVA